MADFTFHGKSVTQFIYEFGDAVILRSNDLLAREANELSSRAASGLGTHSLPFMNQAFAQDIAALLSPAAVESACTLSSLEHTRSGPSFRWLDDVVTDVCVGKGFAGASVHVSTSTKVLMSDRAPSRAQSRRSSSNTTGHDSVSTACSNLGRSLWNVNQHLRSCQADGHPPWQPTRVQIRSSHLPNDSRTASLAYKALRKLQPLVALPEDSRIEWLQHEHPAWKSPAGARRMLSTLRRATTCSP